MFKKTLLKSVVGAASFGAVLATVQFAAPATTVSADFVTVACTNPYHDSVGTKTVLSLDNAFAQYGATNNAHVTVLPTGNVDQTPRGRVRVVVDGEWSDTVRLEGGRANVRLPRGLDAGHTYAVRARYIPTDCSTFKASTSDTKEYTVWKANTVATASSPDITSGDRPRVRVTVDSTHVTVNGGDAAVRLFKDGDLVQRRVVDITDGDAVAWFKAVRERGVWEARVRYLGTRNFQADTTRTTARVTR